MATPDISEYALEDGHKAYVRVWTPSTTPKAHLLFLHGFSDHIDLYDTFFNIVISQYPIRIIGWDRRGWGKTIHGPLERGNTGDMHKQIADLNYFLNHVASDIPDIKATPLFLMGHSMGGQETAYYILNSGVIEDDARHYLTGVILESPYIGLDPKSEPSAIKVFLGRLAGKILPHFQIPNPVQLEYISHDPAVQKMYKEDKLCHNLGTLECFRDMLERDHELSTLARKPDLPSSTLMKQLPCPILWTHGSGDKIADYPVSKLLCETLKPCSDIPEDKVFKGYDGWYHQLHNEPNGHNKEYAKDVGDWIMSLVARES